MVRSSAQCPKNSKIHAGPIAAVNPDGVWYDSVTLEIVERIVAEQLRAESRSESLHFSVGLLPR